MLIDNARAESVAIEKHGRKVVVVIPVEEYERLKAQDNAMAAKAELKENGSRGAQEIRTL